MKPFECFLAHELDEFIAWRENLGLKNRNFRSYLRSFDRHVTHKKADWDDFTPMFFLELQGRIPGENRTVNITLSAVHGFFKFLVRREYLAENPLQDIPPRPENRFIPFLFAPEEVDQLLLLVQKRIRKKEDGFLRDYTVYMAFLLLARCGLRISEPLRLTVESYRHKERTIYIEKTKFYKDRLVPLPRAVAGEMKNYLVLRHRFAEKGNRYLLPGVLKGRGITSNYIYPIFHQVVRDIGLAQKKQRIGTTTFGSPTVHSLRHSFAVNTLNSIKQRGGNPQNALPVLSAYMGHRKYAYTSLYLKMIDAGQRNNLVDFTISHREAL